jgi:MFS family permease
MFMSGTLMSVLALLVGAVAINFGVGLQSALLALRAQFEGFSTVLTGLVMSSYYAGFVLGSLISPRLVNRVGHIRAFATLASLASVIALFHAMIVDPFSWVVFRMISGACFAGLSLVTESWLNHKTNNLNRGALLSVYFVLILGATAIGQLGLRLAPVTGYDLFALVSVVISLALVPVSLTSKPCPTGIAPRWMPFRQLFSKAPVGVAGCLGAGMGTGAFWSLGAIYAHGIGLDAGDTAFFLALMVLGGMISQWPLGKLSDLVDRRFVITGMCICMAGLSTFVGLMTHNTEPWLFYMGMAAGLLILPMYSISIAHTNDRMEPKDYVSAGASLLLVYGFGATVGPLMATVIMEYVGPEGLFLHAAIVFLPLGLYAFYRTFRAKRTPDDETVDFGLVPRTSPMTFVLDPRTDEGGDDVAREQDQDSDEVLPHAKDASSSGALSNGS